MANEKIKRDWLVRATDIFNGLEVNVIYNAPSVRKFLRKKCNDSISVPTTEKLLMAIIEAQDRGLEFKINNKSLKLILKDSATSDKLYELIEV